MDSSLIITVQNEKYSKVFEFDFHSNFTRNEIYEYCIKISETLSEEIFGETLLKDLPTLLVKQAKPKSLTLNGNYKQLCFLFSNFYENPQCQFNNTIQEIAIFIYVHFSFTRGNPSPSINEIVEALGGTSTDHIDESDRIKDGAKLKWDGANNQLYYIFKKLYGFRTKKNSREKLNIELFSVKGTQKEIGSFIYDNIDFGNFSPTSTDIISVLGRRIDTIIKKNIPDIDWAEINKLQ